jgi:glycosyltransferase involved in cell wall biosynthesis
MPTSSPNRQIRVGVDFHVVDGKYQGSRSHLLGLFGEMIRLFPDYRFLFFLSDIESLRGSEHFAAANVELIYMPRASAMVRLLWLLPRLRKRFCLDVLHTQYVIPLWPGDGYAVTIHDILFERFPEYFTRLFVLRSRILMRWSARRADMVFTVSEYSKRELSLRYGLAEERIGILSNAVDVTRFYPGRDGKHHITRRGLLPRGFILTVGRIEPRKNHARLITAYGRMSGPPPLVIVGQRDFQYGDFERALKSLPLTHKVHVLSDVGDEELPAFYRHALAFVYPSFAEGFGMPPLEALASGTPVVTSSTTGIPEVIADAGLLIDPTDEAALTAALARVCADAQLRELLISKGLKRASRFSWQQSAQVLGRTYRAYMDNRH